MDFQAFAADRRRLLQQRLNGEPVLVVGGAEVPIHVSDEFYPFRQEPNFYYLTGITDPGYAALLGGDGAPYELFIPRLDLRWRVWMGHVPELESSQVQWHADRVSFLDELEDRIVQAAGRRGRLHLVRASNPHAADVARALRERLPRLELVQGIADQALVELRLRKTEFELGLMRQAAEVTREAFFAYWKITRPGRNECDVQAALEHTFRSRGALTAYYPIIGSGPNPAILHYHENRRTMQAGEMLLVDAGSELHGYKSDVTRTIPVDGQWTGRQRAVYEVVLSAQTRAIERVEHGVFYPDLHRACARDLVDGLQQIGLVRGDLDGLMERHVDHVFFPHGLGHPIGLETHDVGGHIDRDSLPDDLKHVNLRTSRTIEAGFVVTIEPGIYFNVPLLESSRADATLRDAVVWDEAFACVDEVGGVRIEDDVVVQRGGRSVLTHDIPKEIAAIPIG
jgi:Xaa-Pro dipeptidase